MKAAEFFRKMKVIHLKKDNLLKKDVNKNVQRYARKIE